MGAVVGAPVNRAPAVVALVSAGLMALGSFLPWAQITAPFVGTVTKSGVEGGDGWFTVAAGVVVAVLGFTLWSSRPKPAQRVLLALAGLGAGTLTLFEFVDIGRRFADAKSQMDSSGSLFGASASDLVHTSFGIGLYVLILGSIAAVVAAGMAKD